MSFIHGIQKEFFLLFLLLHAVPSSHLGKLAVSRKEVARTCSNFSPTGDCMREFRRVVNSNKTLESPVGVLCIMSSGRNNATLAVHSLIRLLASCQAT